MHITSLAEELLLRSAVLFLIVGSLSGLVVGALLLWYPDRLRLVSAILNRWITTRRLNQPLERSIKLDPWFYRYHRASAGLILLGSGYIVYAFTLGLDRVATVAGLSRRFNLPPGLTGGLLDALVLSALSGAMLAIFVSLFLLLRPSMLRDFEKGANRWISLRRALKPLEVRRDGVDEFIFKHGRHAGILLVLGSLYTVVLLTIWLGNTR